MSDPPPAGEQTRHAAARVRRLQEHGRHRLDELLVPRRFPGRALNLFASLQGLDRAMSLAARFFVAMIPLVAVIGAIASGPGSLGDRLAQRMDLSGSSATAVRELFSNGAHGTSFGVFGVVILLYVLLSLARALQRVFADLWGLPRRAVSDSKEALRWVPLAVAYGFALWLEGLLAAVGLRDFLALLIGIVVNGAFWTVTPWILMGRRVSVRLLLPGGVLSALGLAGADIWLALYVPGAIDRYVGSYGSIGIGMAVISVLLVISTVLVVAAVIAAALAKGGDQPVQDAAAPGGAVLSASGTRSAGERSMFFFEGVYDDLAAAEADYEAIRMLRAEGAIGSYDAAIVTRSKDGRVRVTRTEKPAQHGAWLGLAAGAAIAVAAPVAMPALVAAGGAGVGAWIGHLARGISGRDAAELGELIGEGSAALIVIGLERDAERIERAIGGAEKRLTKQVDVDAGAAEREALAAIERG